MQTPLQKGDSMIEVLISLVILSVGLLGTIGMEINALQQLRVAQDSDRVALLTQQIANKVLANTQAAIDDAYTHSETIDESSKDCTVEVCNPSELAQFDLFQWHQRLTEQLARGQGQISRDEDSDLLKITIRWDADRSGSTDTHCPKQSADDLDCYQYQILL